jgi:tetratricopeptide (TPR) repeat protein
MRRAWAEKRGLCATVFLLASAVSAPAAGASSADELVLQARAHEATHEDDIAVRRYSDALTLDPTNADAWLGLAALRVKLGDLVEADRVYSAALERVPSLRRALLGRARARWALGHHVEAEEDLETYATEGVDLDALRELAGWFGSDGRAPLQLATWRRLLAAATRVGDPAFATEARRMVRALVILVDGADPASSPVDPDPVRQAMARIARRGG